MFLGDRLPIVQRMILADDARRGERRARGAARAAAQPTSRASSRRWTACRSPSACSTRRCTSSSPTSRSCSSSRRKGELDAKAERKLLDGGRARGARSNPMLGTRGCRLGILKPGLYRMQVRALIEAAVDAQAGRRRPARRDHDPADREPSPSSRCSSGWVREEADAGAAPTRASSCRLPRRHDDRDATRRARRRARSPRSPSSSRSAPTTSRR